MTFPSSEDLDAEVSAKVFKQPLVMHERICINGTWYDSPTWLPVGADPADPPPGTTNGWRPPRYSSRIADAWLVMEWMRNAPQRIKNSWVVTHIAKDGVWNFRGLAWWAQPEEDVCMWICLTTLRAVATVKAQDAKK